MSLHVRRDTDKKLMSWQAMARMILGHLHMVNGDMVRAIRNVNESVFVFREFGQKNRLVEALFLRAGALPFS